MVNDLLSDAVEQLLADASPPRRVREIEAGGSAEELWAVVAGSGFADALVPEERGGAGLGLSGALPILHACGRHALPVPLAHTMAVRAVLAAAGHPWPEGAATFAEAATDEVGATVCRRVPFGRVAAWVMAGGPDGSRLLPVSAAEVIPTGVHGSLEADLRWSAPSPAAVVPGETPWRVIGAALHAALLAGALERVLEGTVAHANDRVQFGRSIGKFQAIQQQLSVAAEHVFAARMAARIGCSGASHLPDALHAAVAKARASEAAVVVAAIAHAVQGAMGIAEESDLQLHARRLHEWRLASGSERHWNERIGEAVLSGSADGLVSILRERLSPSPQREP